MRRASLKYHAIQRKGTRASWYRALRDLSLTVFLFRFEALSPLILTEVRLYLLSF